jgi:stage II sporulation protein D
MSRFPSGRVEKIRLGGATLTGAQFRKLIDVRSTNFTISYSRYSIIFTAEGFGHGVGMSQVGAQVMAKEGQTYQDILAHYYTGTKLTKIS